MASGSCGVPVYASAFAGTHCAYPQAELTWVAWLHTKMIYRQTVNHLSSNLAQHTVALLMRPSHQVYWRTCAFKSYA